MKHLPVSVPLLLVLTFLGWKFFPVEHPTPHGAAVRSGWREKLSLAESRSQAGSAGNAQLSSSLEKQIAAGPEQPAAGATPSPHLEPVAVRRADPQMVTHISETHDQLPLSFKATQGRTDPAVGLLSEASDDAPAPASNVRVAEALAGLPLWFEKNEGQVDSNARFFSRIGNQLVFFTQHGVVFRLEESRETDQLTCGPADSESCERGIGFTPQKMRELERLSNVMLKFVGANANAEISGEEILLSRSNYLIGNNPAGWKTDISQYAKVRYKQLYAGIDVVFYGQGQQLEYDLIVAPGADPGVIRLQVEELDSVPGLGSGAGEGGGGIEKQRDGGVDSGYGTATVRERRENGGQVGGTPSEEAEEREGGRAGEGESAYGTATVREWRENVGQVGDAQSEGAGEWVMGDGGIEGWRDEGYRVSGVGYRIDANGDLVLNTSAGEIRQLKPRIYQEVDGVKLPVPGRYVLKSVASGQQSVVSGQQVSKSPGLQVSDQWPIVRGQDGRQVHGSAGPRAETVQDRELFTVDHGQRTHPNIPHSAFHTPHSKKSEIRNPKSEIRNSDTRHPLVAFQIDAYDKSRPLVIDPKVVTPVNIPGSGNQQVQGIAADAQGSWYLTGSTDSTDFATRNPIQSARAGSNFDAFVMKLSPDGKTIIYSTYLGGARSDSGFGIAVDSSGSSYVVGMTDSSDFPTRNPIQSAYAGPASPSTFRGDTFVAKLSPDGSSLVYSTYLGGSQSESAGGIAVDSSGNAYVAGQTNSTNFPTRNPLQSTMTPAGTTGTFFSAGFISKLNASGSALVYSTFFGGATNIHGIAVDSAGNVYVAGNAGTIPSPNGFQRTPGSLDDAFVAKVNSAGSAVVYSTYLGGSGRDQGFAIAIDALGSAYVSGSTESTNFPTASAFMPTRGGGTDAFVTKLNPAGTALVYSSYLGGSEFEDSKGIAVDSTGRAYIGGRTQSTNFPVKDATQAALGGGSDVFVTQLTPAGAIEFSTYNGTAASEYTNAIAVGPATPQKVGGDGTRYQESTGPPIGVGGGQFPPGTGTFFSILSDQPKFPPTEEFIDNCIRIVDLSQQIETNGAVARLLGAKLGWRVTTSNIGGRLFGKIQEAVDFVGTDEAAHKLDFRSNDIVRLGPCTFTENVVVPAQHATTGPLSQVTIEGVGAETRIISTGGTTIQVNATGRNRIQELSLGGSGKSDYLVDTSPSSIVDALHIQAADAANGFNLRAGGRVTECNFTNFTGSAVTGSGGRLTAEGRNRTFPIFFDTVGTGIRIEDAELTASYLKFENVAFEAITVTGGQSKATVQDVTAGTTTVPVAVNVSGLSGNNKVLINRLTGRQVLVKDSFSGAGASFTVEISGSLIAGSKGPGIFINNSTVFLIGNRDEGGIQANRIGIEIRNASRVLALGNDIRSNTEAGILKDRSSQCECNNNIFAYNGRGLSDNIVSTKSSGVVQSEATSATDVFQDNVFLGNTGAGIELTADSNVDLGRGTGGSKGGNILLGNGTFDLINSTGARISAKNNIWSSADPNEILSRYVSPGTGGVDVAPVMPVRSISFAQFVEAPGFTSTVALVDPSRTNGAAALLAFRNAAGSGINVPLNSNNSPGGLQPAAMAPLGARFFSTNPETSAVNIGSMTVASGRPLAGAVIFSSPAGVAGVGQSEPLTQFIAPVERNVSRSTNSGIAVTNPNTSAAVSLQLRLRESATGVVREGRLDVPAGGQVAKFIDELFAGLPADFSGTLSVTSTTAVAATVIRTSPGQFATLPVTGAGARNPLFAQFGEASGLSSALTFVSPSTDRTANVTVRLNDDNGAPLTVNLNGTDRAGQFTFSIPPQSSVTFTSPGTSATARIGAVTVESTENIGGTVLFGGSFGLAGVGASQQLSNFVAPVEQSTAGGVTIGVAMVNAGAAQITVRLTLRDESGTAVEGGTVNVVLPARGHVARFLAQFFPNLDLANFRGTITGETTGQIGATVIRQSATPLEFATLPVAEITP